MKTQKLLAPLRKAVNDFDMIQAGDTIAVGVSGGKDSLTLLTLLKAFQRFESSRFDLMAITIDMHFTEDAYLPVAEYCRAIDVPYVVEKTDIAEILFDIRKESSPCSLCSKMRRGALNSVLLKNGCNKLALGHHKDDVVETFMLSLVHEGRLSTFAPISYMSRSRVTLIRPMVYISEREISSFAKEQALPVVHNPCPADKHTEREAMKDILRGLQGRYPDISERFAAAIMHPERYNLWNDVSEKYRKEKGE